MKLDIAPLNNVYKEDGRLCLLLSGSRLTDYESDASDFDLISLVIDQALLSKGAVKLAKAITAYPVNFRSFSIVDILNDCRVTNRHQVMMHICGLLYLCNIEEDKQLLWERSAGTFHEYRKQLRQPKYYNDLVCWAISKASPNMNISARCPHRNIYRLLAGLEYDTYAKKFIEHDFVKRLKLCNETHGLLSEDDVILMMSIKKELLTYKQELLAIRGGFN